MVTHSYDAANRRVRTDVARGTDVGGSTLQTFAWDGLSRPIAAADNNEPASAADNSVLAFAFDSLSHPRSETQDGRAVSSTHDRVGSRLSETFQPGNRQTAYTYDSLYRLTSAQASGSTSQYSYDPAGNRTMTVKNGKATAYTTNLLNQYLAVGTEIRSYDRNGNLVWMRTTSAPAPTRHLYLSLLLKQSAATGVLAAGSNVGAMEVAAAETLTETVFSYRYDFGDRLVGLTRTLTVTSGAGAQVTTTIVSFAYDGFGRQVGTAAATGDRRFVYAGGRAIEERGAGGAVIASYVSLLAMNRGGTRTFFQTDGTRSVRGLADAAGAILERVEYDAFGTPAFSGGGQESAQGNPFLFRGHRYAAGGVFYVLGSRRYEPAVGRYSQRGEEVLGNPYSFAGSNPLGSAAR